jgi:hypothetical protein
MVEVRNLDIPFIMTMLGNLDTNLGVYSKISFIMAKSG